MPSLCCFVTGNDVCRRLPVQLAPKIIIRPPFHTGPGFVGAAFWIIRAKFCANGVNAVYALHTERYLGSEWLVLVRDAFIAVQLMEFEFRIFLTRWCFPLSPIVSLSSVRVDPQSFISPPVRIRIARWSAVFDVIL